MPFPREGRRGRRLIGGMLVAGTVATTTLVCLAVTPSYAADDYPYRGLGQCPLVPLPPKPPVKPGHAGPHQPGATPGGPGKPGPQTPAGGPASSPGHPPVKPGGPPPPKPPPPPRVCAKHIWFYNGTYGDPWGFALRNCTSFVAWRLRETNGMTDFSNHMDGGRWGDAFQWDDNARALGYLVDDVPAVGAVAQSDGGRIGHVAWVSAVGDGTVTIEEYNYGVAGGYDTRTVPTSEFDYIHVQDISPAPYLGSTRAAATAVDARRGVWTARTAHGDLTVRRPTGRSQRLGVPGSWSSYAAPSVAVDTRGQVWVAAVSRAGRLFLGHTGSGSPRFGRLRPVGPTGWSTTSTPTLTVDAQGRLRLFAVTASGDLVERHTAGRHSDRLGRADRMGLPGSWSTHAAPAVTTDAQGRLWLSAVTRRGALQSQHTRRQGLSWTGFRRVDARTWSVTSTPSLAVTHDGRVWLAAVTARGGLFSRSTDGRSPGWRRTSQLPGLWSPYASPSISTDATGRLWMAATAVDGHVTIRVSRPAGSGWSTPRTYRHADGPVTSTSVLATPTSFQGGGVRVGTVVAGGRLRWGAIGSSPAAAARGPRPGGFSAIPWGP